jgi:AbiV family abortive infection protein
MAKTMPVPDLDALGDLALAAVRNVRRLLDDADLLLKRGRWPSAYSLAVLAFEEGGKAWMCIIAMVPDDVWPEWPYGDLITPHVDKLMAAHVMAHMLASATSGRDMIADLADVGENLQELACEHNHAKQRGLYADLLDDTVWEACSPGRSAGPTAKARPGSAS